MRTKRFTITQNGQVLVKNVRATSIQRIADWLGGKLISSCPGWGLVQLDKPLILFGITLAGELSIHRS